MPFVQHAIRASGVACQPAHTATFPTDRAQIAASAARCRVEITLYLECGTHRAVSNFMAASGLNAAHGECQSESRLETRESAFGTACSAVIGERLRGAAYTRSMVKRLFSLLVALAIVGAPVALEACQIVCASTLVHPMAAHDTHQAHHHHVTAADKSCHEPRAAPHRLSPQAPPCDHDGEATVPSVAAARASDGVLLHAAAVPPIADVVVAAASTFVPTRQSTLPDRLENRLARPLRI